MTTKRSKTEPRREEDKEASLADFMRFFDETGWDRYIINKRCHDLARINALASIGLVSSADMKVSAKGGEEFRLNLTKRGAEIRRHLMEREEAGKP